MRAFFEDRTMLRVLTRLISALLLATAFAQSPAQSIPPIQAQSLAGNQVNLPADLQGRTAILILGFSRGSQAEVTAWGKRLAADYPATSRLQTYELAILASVPRPIRGFVTRAMKKSVPERAQPFFLPLTSDEAAWRTLTRYQSGDSAFLLVVSSTGQVLWQTNGPPTEAALHDLALHLR